MWGTNPRPAEYSPFSLGNYYGEKETSRLSIFQSMVDYSLDVRINVRARTVPPISKYKIALESQAYTLV